MKRILLITIVVMLMVPVNANAFSWRDFFRTLFGLSTQEVVVEKTTIKEDVDKALNDTIKQMKDIDKTTQSAFLSIVSKISGENELKTIKEKLTSANKQKDDNERIKAVNQIYNDYSTVINNNKLEFILIVKLLNDSEKQALVKDINTISANGEKYVELGKQNVKLASDTIKKANVEDDRVILLNNINKVSSDINDSAKAATSLSRQAKILASLAGIKF